MLKVVRLFFAIGCRRIALVAWLLMVTVSVPAQTPSRWLKGFKSVADYRANAKLITFDRFVQIKETGAPDSTPTFSTAQPLSLLAAKDFVAPDVADNDKDRAKLKGAIKAPERDKPALPSNVPIATDPNSQFGEQAGFQWRSAWQQSLMFLGMQHAFRMATEKGSRAELKGPFFKDYFATLKNLAAWDDGDPFIVNYIGHPMMGSVTGYIQIQNDPRGINQELGLNKSYWKSRLKAFGWSFVYSTQFELGPLSEASLGNVGIRPYEGHKHPMAYVDIVVTPVVGTAWLVGEDALDKYLIRQLDQRVKNRVAQILLRSFLNPTRSLANVLRGKYPWYRDDRGY